MSAAIFKNFRTLCALLRSRSTPRTLCLLRCCHGEAYLGASISVLCATDRSIGLPELRHCKRSLSDEPGCKIPEAQLLLCSSTRSETCETEEKRHQQSFAVSGLAHQAILLRVRCLFRVDLNHVGMSVIAQ